MTSKKLNNVETFCSEGFKIKRNGEVITLTPEEMRAFRELDSALDGRGSIEWYLDDAEYNNLSETEVAKLQEMMEDDDVCYRVNQTFLEYVLSEAGEDERDAVRYELNLALKEGGFND